MRREREPREGKTTLIRGGTVVLGRSVSRQDLLIRGQKIAAVGDLRDCRADKVIDADGLLLLPGGVDSHVHFNDVFMNTVSVHDYYTGTRAAAYGGVTSVIDFSNQGPGEALIKTLENKREEKIASMLGHRFSVVSAAKHSIPNKEALIRKYHLQDMLASVRAPEDGTAAISDEEKYLEAARLALREDMAEVIVLGCAGMAGLDKRLQERLGAPVLDGVICALIIATGLVKYGVGTSKVRRYKAD